MKLLFKFVAAVVSFTAFLFMCTVGVKMLLLDLNTPTMKVSADTYMWLGATSVLGIVVAEAVHIVLRGNQK
jgi:hypothetical protein